jgi:predicted  nucleic acid-binding Zn-ribbon protein
MGVKAAPEDQALLLELQDLDTRLQRLDHQLRNLPETARLAELEGEAQQLRRTLAEQTGVLEDAQAELGRVESDVAVVEARIERDRERLQASSSVKDVQALEQELAALARRRDELEEIELAVMERVEEHETALASTRGALEEVDASIADTTAVRDAGAASLQQERGNVATDRETVAARVPAELLALYEKQRARYGVGASHLRGGVSSASGVALNATDLGAVRAAAPDDVLLCPDSSAILVRTAESGL